MHSRILMPSKADKTHFALLFRLLQSLGGAIRPHEQLGIVIECDAMNLPEIEMVGLQTPQRLLKHPHCEIFVASVRAYFGHQEDPFPLATQRRTHPVFGFSAMIFPAIIEKCDAAVDRI